MSAKHTHGKLIVRPDGGSWSASHEGNGSTAYMGIVNDQGTTIALAVAHSTDHFNEPEGPDEDARRLIACWNACEGLYTESLERGGPLAEQIVNALNQRDQLLSALNAVLQWIDDYCETTGFDQIEAQANAAIANVTGGTPV